MQCEPYPIRAKWGDFPEVIVHSSIYRLKNLDGYYAAKFGDHEAATRIARQVIKPDKIDLRVDYVVPVVQVDFQHYNAIPVAFAALLAKALGARLWLEIRQINKVDHTEANAIGRMKNQPRFGGPCPKGDVSDLR